MEQSKDTPSQLNRFQTDRMHNINNVEWRNKRKLQSDQLDLLRPKHKCRVRHLSSEHASIFDEKPHLESINNHTMKSITDTTIINDRSEFESAKDNNSCIDDSDTAMSINEEAKLEADCTNTYLHVKSVSCSEDATIVDSECGLSYHDVDTLTSENYEEHLLGLESFPGHGHSELAEDNNEHSVNKEFEDFLYSNRVNPHAYVLSSGQWNADKEVQSSTRPPTIDLEFEQYFSTLML
ncbi:unnamed protein product [Lupinus luteus]|uniref:Uncharacterized protein n=1 Tax=Lupinus luteus TaxID=3873 RepID=A0AAV1W637_LUPLU